MAREVVSKAEKLPVSKIDWEKEQATSTMFRPSYIACRSTLTFTRDGHYYTSVTSENSCAQLCTQTHPFVKVAFAFVTARL